MTIPLAALSRQFDVSSQAYLLRRARGTPAYAPCNVSVEFATHRVENSAEPRDRFTWRFHHARGIPYRENNDNAE